MYINLIVACCKKYPLIFFILLSTSFSYTASFADSDGIVLQGTRVIYPESAKSGITFNVTNRTMQAYLLQSRILPWRAIAPKDIDGSRKIDMPGNVESVKNETESVPFIVLPPLTRFETDETLTLHIRSIKNSLPSDRESVFMLALKAIPGQESKNNQSEVTGTKMMLALQNNIKLFYRPNGLEHLDAASRAEQLSFSINQGHINIKNSSPYFITLSQLMLGDVELLSENQRMIEPFGSAIYAIKGSADRVVSWQILDDDGLMTVKQQRSLL